MEFGDNNMANCGNVDCGDSGDGNSMNNVVVGDHVRGSNSLRSNTWSQGFDIADEHDNCPLANNCGEIARLVIIFSIIYNTIQINDS